MGVAVGLGLPARREAVARYDVMLRAGRSPLSSADEGTGPRTYTSGSPEEGRTEIVKGERTGSPGDAPSPAAASPTAKE